MLSLGVALWSEKLKAYCLHFLPSSPSGLPHLAQSKHCIIFPDMKAHCSASLPLVRYQQHKMMSLCSSFVRSSCSGQYFIDSFYWSRSKTFPFLSPYEGGTLVPQKTGSHKTVGHLFKSQIWISENFSSFLVLSGTENKRNKIPPPHPPKKKNIHRDLVAIPLSKAFYFKLHLGFSLHPWKPFCLSMDMNQCHSERIDSMLMLQSPCTGTLSSSALQFCGEIVSHVLFDLPICNTSELHLGWLLTHPIQSRVSENFEK